MSLRQEVVYLAVIAVLGFLLFFSSYMGAMEITDGGAPTAPAWSNVLSVLGVLAALLGAAGVARALVRSSREASS